MRVLFLTHRLPYAPNRGDRVRAYHMLRMLAARMEVDLVSLVHDREEESRAEELRHLAASVTTARVPRLWNLAHGGAAFATSRPLTHALLDAPDLQAAIAKRMAVAPPDVVLAYCSGMARFALEPPLHQKAFVLDMVDVDSAKWSALAETRCGPKRWIFGREARLLSRFEATATRRACATLVVNERERAALCRLAPDGHIHIVPNGVDTQSLRPLAPPTEAPRLAFCGVMNYAPNEEAAEWIVRRVWPDVRARRPDARLLIVGSDPTRRVRQLGSDDPTVTVTGGVPDVRPYLWDSAVAVAPLFTARGVQNKVLEAIAAGLPCVVTPAVFDGLPGEVRPACSLAHQPEAFAAELVRLLSLTGEERRSIASRANLAPLEWSSRLGALPDILETAARTR